MPHLSYLERITFLVLIISFVCQGQLAFWRKKLWFDVYHSGTLLLSPRNLSRFTNSSTECTHQCLSKSFCVGFNFKKTKSTKDKNCVLFPYQRFDKKSQRRDQQWTYYQMPTFIICSRSLRCPRFQFYPTWNEEEEACYCKALLLVSRRKLVSQSSTELNAYAAKAIDGSKNVYLEYGSCTHTSLEKDPWWNLDLGLVHYVATVAITNRGGICYSRFTNGEVRVGMKFIDNGKSNRLCTQAGFRLGDGETKIFNCDFGFLRGRYVTIILRGSNRLLTMCEVEVMGVRLPVTTPFARFIMPRQ